MASMADRKPKRARRSFTDEFKAGAVRLVVDELGFVPFDRTGGELLFNLLTDRYERRATVVTTNLAFAEWVTVFAGDEKLTTALLDRLAHHATVLTTEGKSFRMRKRRTREEPS